jgi:hypothetical protein
MTKIPQIEFPDTFRSYVIVALTVQTPVKLIEVGGRFTNHRYSASIGPTEETRTIVQPSGRLAAQACHATAVMTAALFKNYIYYDITHKDRLSAYEPSRKIQEFWEGPPAPITRIVLAARDSYELHHVYHLLRVAKIPVYDFIDRNTEAYGPGVEIMTAFATEPVDKEEVIGLIDYLPLWDPDKKE